MQNIVFKDRIKLEKRKNGYGSHPEPQTVAEKDVWACVCLPSMTTKTTALSVGISVDLTIHMFRNEYMGEAIRTYFITMSVIKLRVQQLR